MYFWISSSRGANCFFRNYCPTFRLLCLTAWVFKLLSQLFLLICACLICLAIDLVLFNWPQWIHFLNTWPFCEFLCRKCWVFHPERLLVKQPNCSHNVFFSSCTCLICLAIDLVLFNFPQWIHFLKTWPYLRVSLYEMFCVSSRIRWRDSNSCSGFVINKTSLQTILKMQTCWCLKYRHRYSGQSLEVKRSPLVFFFAGLTSSWLTLVSS